MIQLVSFATSWFPLSAVKTAPDLDKKYDFAVLQGSELKSCMDEVAYLWMTVFREYPYLFDGTPEEVRGELMQLYLPYENSSFIMVRENGRVIGAIAGVPLNQAAERYQSYFLKEKIPMESTYYLGEIVLLKEYRKEGIGARMYELFEQHVREKKIYDRIAFCEVIQSQNDPRRPSDYVKLDHFWSKRNYVKHPDYVIWESWKEVDSKEVLNHPMVFWLKNL